MAERRSGILITGFDVFGGHPRNISNCVASALDGTRIGPWTVHGAILPVEFARAHAALTDAVDRMDPSMVIALGMETRDDHIAIERIALNLDDSAQADATGAVRVGRKIVVDATAPAAYFSGFAVEKVLEALQTRGFAARSSRDAGGFICNHVFYRACELAEKRAGLVAGFVHLPQPPHCSDGTEATWALHVERMSEAVRIVAEVSASREGLAG